MDSVMRRMVLEIRIDGLRRDMLGMERRLIQRIDLKTEFLENSLHSAIENLGISIAGGMAAQTRTFLFSTFGALAAMAAFAFAPIGPG